MDSRSTPWSGSLSGWADSAYLGQSVTVHVVRLGVILILGSLLMDACGGEETAACTEIREPAEPQSFSHVIDTDSVTYSSNPPTSGPHMAVPVPTGILDAPIVAPLQVRLLESGAALVQWEGVEDETVAELEALAGPAVVVAPGLDLPEPIVATAWTWKLLCTAVDTSALSEFVTTRPDSAPGQD